MTDNEKKALNLEAALSLTHRESGDRREAGGQNKEGNLTEAEREKGMAEMSEKYTEMGSELYLSEDGTNREAID